MYAAIATMGGMTTKKSSKPDVGRRIAARLVELNKSGPAVEAETDGVIYEKLLSRIRTGKKRLKDLSYTKLRRLMYALEWTPEEFAVETGLELPSPPPLEGERPYAPTALIPVYGSVAAGLASTPQEDEIVGSYYLDPSLSGLRGRELDRMVVLTVNGNSMACSRVMNDIPHGSLVVVEKGATPREGDVVVAWIENEGAAVLKRYADDPNVVLTSYRADGPVFRASEYEIDIRGVVRQVIRGM